VDQTGSVSFFFTADFDPSDISYIKAFETADAAATVPIN
jgi:hypothetical protein